MDNYFNYFTEIEECYRRCRSTITKTSPMLLLSPVDWALIESWKDAGIPLEAVLVGIERSFEKFKVRKRKYRMVNTVAYCTQEVLRAAEEAQPGGTPETRRKDSPPPFTNDEVLKFLARNAESVEAASHQVREQNQQVLADDLASVAASLRGISREPADVLANLEEMEIRLTALEEKIAASLTRAASVERLAEIQGEVERGLAPYRGKMSGPQIESLQRQFLKRQLLEQYQIPRLSLFYM